MYICIFYICIAYKVDFHTAFQTSLELVTPLTSFSPHPHPTLSKCPRGQQWQRTSGWIQSLVHRRKHLPGAVNLAKSPWLGSSQAPEVNLLLLFRYLDTVSNCSLHKGQHSALASPEKCLCAADKQLMQKFTTVAPIATRVHMHKHTHTLQGRLWEREQKDSKR